jgi:hypothetical protein
MRLALEAFAELRRGDFDCDVALQTWVAGLGHLSHTALADECKDFVRAEFVALQRAAYAGYC